MRQWGYEAVAGCFAPRNRGDERGIRRKGLLETRSDDALFVVSTETAQVRRSS